MLDVARSGLNRCEYDEYERDPNLDDAFIRAAEGGEPCPESAHNLEDLFIEAIRRNRPLIIRRYGGLGTTPETRTISGMLEFQISNANADPYCQILGKRSCTIPIEKVLKEFETEDEERKRVLNILGFAFVHHPTLSQNTKPIKFLERVDLLRRVSCNRGDFNEQRLDPKVATDCGFIVMSMGRSTRHALGSYTNFHLDMFSTIVVMEEGLKLWTLFPNTEKNVEARLSWTEEKGLGVFEGLFSIFLHPDDLLFLPDGWNHAVYTLSDSFMTGCHTVTAETAARNLKLLMLFLENPDLTNDPLYRAFRHFKNLIDVMTFLS
jgi:JmjC domain